MDPVLTLYIQPLVRLLHNMLKRVFLPLKSKLPPPIVLAESAMALPATPHFDRAIQWLSIRPLEHVSIPGDTIC